MGNESVPSVQIGYVEYAVRYGIVSHVAPLSEVEKLTNYISCPNPRCINGGFRIRVDASEVTSERCKGYVRLPGNQASFCNYFIRYRVHRAPDAELGV